MKTKLLIATCDTDYAEHLSKIITKNYSDALVLTLCNTQEGLRVALEAQRFDAALLETQMIEGADLSLVSLPLLLVSPDDDDALDIYEYGQITKYQRVSAIVSELLSRCALVSKYVRGSSLKRADVTAVWGPAGGVGKTTVALSYAAQKVAEGKQVLYLNLESFSSVPAYFAQTGKSISAVFEMLENSDGNVKMLIRGICQQDSGVGMAYFCRPENFDDMYALSAENIAELTSVCAGVTEELVIDMSCVCDRRTRKVFELADKVLLVTDPTATAQVKLSQFSTQHTVFESIKDKVVLVANKGAELGCEIAQAVWKLPFVQSANHTAVYKALSGSFEEQSEKC